MTDRYIHFDWAMKRMLRDKANHAVIEGLLTSLFGEEVTIERFLESEGNQTWDDDKFNRVDILAENSWGEMIMVEILNTRMPDYFERMHNGLLKVPIDYADFGIPVGMVSKVYSVNITYFARLGVGTDYVYHGTSMLRGLHTPHDTLILTKSQRRSLLGIDENDVPFDDTLQTEYYVLRVEEFDQMASTPLDEWVYYLKTGDISDSATAPGLAKARECLRIDDMSVCECKTYIRRMELLRDQQSIMSTYRNEGIEEGLAQVRNNIGQ